MTRQMTGAKMVVQALKNQGVDTVFGYPGGAALPRYAMEHGVLQGAGGLENHQT